MAHGGNGHAPDGIAAPSGARATPHDRPRNAFDHVICADAHALQARPPFNGGKFFRNHINFHHTYYSKDHLISRAYLGDEGNNTPFFFVPVFLVGACTYFVLPVDLFVVQVVACAVSFYAHVFFRQGIPRRGIAASAVCMVQTETGTALRSSPAREQQFRGDPFLLG